MFGKDAEEGRRDSAEERSRVVADLRRRIGGMGVAARSAWEHGGDAGDGGDAASGHAVASSPAGPAAPVGPAEPAAPDVPAAPPPSGPAVPDTLAVPGPLAAVLPRGGIPRGSVVGLASTAPGGGGATGLLLSLLAAPRGTWAAVVGLPDLGLLAAAELGVDLDRLGLIPDPGPDALQVLSVLADGVDVIATAPPANLPPARQRVLTGRLRQRGTVLLVMGRWPGADLTMTVRDVRWSGIGQGHGRLRDREIDVQVGGRRSGAGSTVTLLLRSTRTTVTVIEAARPPAEGAGSETGAIGAGAAGDAGTDSAAAGPERAVAGAARAG